MFDLDRWQEIFSSIRSNVLRTVLSGFTVALGLFIFIVLFGIGKGLQNAFTEGFARDAQNLISIFTGKTTIAYNGLQSDRQVTMDNDDYDFLINNDKEKVGYSSPRYTANLMVKYGKESGNYQINGADTEEKYIENRKMLEGRYLSPMDLQRKQNVAVIGRMVQRDLIKNGSPVGKDLDINGTMFKIVGVFSDDGGDWDERHISIPITTLQQMKKGSDTVSTVYIAYNENLNPEQAIKYGDELKSRLKSRKNVSPDDENGVRVWNNAQNMSDTFTFMAVLTGIVGFIGIGTLLAGIIGISNIMVYIVKERTKEIGVRKAIGAKPGSIVALIVQESVVITVVSGFVGVGLGVLALNLIGDNLEEYFIKNPSVGWFEIIAAFIALVFSGLIAGFVPAYRASKIKPIEALRTE
ncbi:MULTISPECIES: ABC transporter permease [Chryseobacterium]|uniref:Putative ABC transport system permease protein n=1 Tax=Chryseobacterium scophthalmum TaxID=59733 RepID=A0A1N6I8G3_9FLAO|nr:MULTISPECIES: ABC transporter permease [Chryseobacterium]MBM7419157.1 putative ABC transport system permease protein [Chryseobacterium sp. JUb44]MDH6209080.1 putative ABC transport system permease protein [Chryseobacterium sp. BIGb0186]WSO11931.1 ABC transporter permease [Chryseobacterium scophthalmum]SIO28306.1 putative ABC transport system permease protein [Chryseobacterium scophthalmum]VXC55152.1 putative ABC transport system permease protein [Chryseobacterium sp. 8AT]